MRAPVSRLAALVVVEVALGAHPGAPDRGLAVRIMPLGDSITESYADHASYRYFLWHLLRCAGYEVDFVGSMHGVYGGDASNSNFDQDHEGHSGWTADQILVELDGWAAEADPDIVLVHLGTNDVCWGEPASDTATDLAGIIDVLRAQNPVVTVLLAQIIPCWGLESRVEALNAEIAALAAAMTTPESPVILVDQWTGFSADLDCFDGVHPNTGGERKMARRWYEALTELPVPRSQDSSSGASCAH